MFTQRPVSTFPIPEYVYGADPQVVLETVAAHKMISLLRQVGEVSNYATEIFAALFNDAQINFERIRHLAGRINVLDSTIPQIEGWMEKTDADFFYQAKKPDERFQLENPYTSNLFTPKTQTPPVQRRRRGCQPPPRLSLLDGLAKQPCMLGFSNPGLFFDMWLREEEERQIKLQKANKAKREKRKKKKKAKRKNRVREVMEVETKVYSAQGKEFEQAKPKMQPSAQESPTKGNEDEVEDDVEDDDDDYDDPYMTRQKRRQASPLHPPPQQNVAPQAPAAPVPPSGMPPDEYAEDPQQGYQAYEQAQYQQDQYEKANYEEAQYEQQYDPALYEAEAAAYAEQQDYHSPVAPDAPMAPMTPYAPVAPVAPIAPMAPQAPIAPYAPASPHVPAAPAAPVIPAAPAAPAIPAAPAAPPLAPAAPAMVAVPAAPIAPKAPVAPIAPVVVRPTGGGLLGEIAAGRKLKKAAPVEKKKDERDDLLGNIRAGVKLKQVDRSAPKPAQPQEETGGLGGIMAVLARRSAIKGDDDEDEDGNDSDDFEDDDWE